MLEIQKNRYYRPVEDINTIYNIFLERIDEKKCRYAVGEVLVTTSEEDPSVTYPNTKWIKFTKGFLKNDINFLGQITGDEFVKYRAENTPNHGHGGTSAEAGEHEHDGNSSISGSHTHTGGVVSATRGHDNYSAMVGNPSNGVYAKDYIFKNDWNTSDEY